MLRSRKKEKDWKVFHELPPLSQANIRQARDLRRVEDDEVQIEKGILIGASETCGHFPMEEV